ncbi:MAG: potassium transporter TrkA [Sulfurimonas sp. RIFCSPHIGHO2_12_FULL_36_9]|uniref:potassium channel family protein n=1 Tax=unclassified Sulfurimonas TaxID=2623549 RepID=UPI0008B9D1B7|nr:MULTISPECIES: TrkA family potassium uptake protein [unclassified Sulfurimonas]OHD96590.1 MAG: potassium transporter TrkA [Sulfurimonas sp. RIFCSPHIGHO2_12_FULL_36_9]OHE02502.1 MAG: potassium transporter TrkA [Sulfurimonas sp. RIFCSPLOWO2_12_36_12]OHE07844.1 MAG: potassium transporter TrkA [Sulfurimonas sp. RIFCSPLOWO2_12_FULL_36_74]
MTYVVIGLGKFGYHVAKGLAQQGEAVIAIDNDEEKIRDISEFVQDAIVLDSSDPKALGEAGIADAEMAIVSIGENLEASILTVMALKELGIETIFAKAITQVHGQILSKLGAAKVIYPEMESAKKLVKKIVKNIHYETIDLSITIKLAKMKVPSFWVGTSILSSVFKENFEVKPIAYKHQGEWHTSFEKDDILEEGDIFVVLGNSNDIEALSKKV